ncbi:MAG TPA: four helix bundle protein, partial [bacterium]|nr:four helix bundle protein [bacterium]
ANIAEGYGRYYYKENISFCRKARGYLNETINHLIEAKDMGFVSAERCEKIIADYISLRMMLNGYIKYLGSRKLED